MTGEVALIATQPFLLPKSYFWFRGLSSSYATQSVKTFLQAQLQEIGEENTETGNLIGGEGEI